MISIKWMTLAFLFVSFSVCRAEPASPDHAGATADAGAEVCPAPGTLLPAAEITKDIEAKSKAGDPGPIVSGEMREVLGLRTKLPNGVLKRSYSLSPLELKEILNPRPHSEMAFRSVRTSPEYLNFKILSKLIREVKNWEKGLTPELKSKLEKGSELSPEEMKALSEAFESNTITNVVMEAEHFHIPHNVTIKELKVINPRTHSLDQLYKHYVIDSAFIKQLADWLKKADLPLNGKLEASDTSAFLKHFSSESRKNTISERIQSEFGKRNACFEVFRFEDALLRKYSDDKNTKSALELILQDQRSVLSEKTKNKISEMVNRRIKFIKQSADASPKEAPEAKNAEQAKPANTQAEEPVAAPSDN